MRLGNAPLNAAVRVLATVLACAALPAGTALSLVAAPVVHAVTGEDFTVRARLLRVRAEPNGSGKILGRLPRGHRVTEVGRDGQWIEVRVSQPASMEQGWVSGAYLTPVPGSAPTEPVAAGDAEAAADAATDVEVPPVEPAPAAVAKAPGTVDGAALATAAARATDSLIVDNGDAPTEQAASDAAAEGVGDDAASSLQAAAQNAVGGATGDAAQDGDADTSGADTSGADTSGADAPDESGAATDPLDVAVDGGTGTTTGDAAATRATAGDANPEAGTSTATGGTVADAGADTGAAGVNAVTNAAASETNAPASQGSEAVALATADTGARSSEAYGRFRTRFDDVMQRFEQRTGRTLFTGAFDEGDGVLRLVSTDYWKVGSQADRTSDVRAVLQMWREANDNLSVAVIVFDERGEKQMTLFE